MFTHESSTHRLQDLAGVVLCGGQSRRMGMPKAWLPCGTDTMLQQIVRRLSEVLARVVVIASPDDSLPVLSSDVLIEHDRNPDRGPLEGLAVGLSSIQGVAHAAMVVACDVPLLRSDLVRRLANLLDKHDAVVPRVEGRPHPLVAVYRTRVLETVERHLAAGSLSLRELLAEIDVRYVESAELQEVDPHLESLRNINRPQQYRDFVQQFGFEVPKDLRSEGGSG